MSRRNRRPKRPTELPRYAQAVIAATDGKVLPGNVYMVDVYHADGCRLLAGKGACNCNPEVGSPERVPFPQEN